MHIKTTLRVGHHLVPGAERSWCTSRPPCALVTISSKRAEESFGAHQDHPMRRSPSRPRGPGGALVHIQATLCVGNHLVQEGRRERWCTSRPPCALVTISSKRAERSAGAHQDHPVRWSPSRPRGTKGSLVHIKTTLCVGHHLVQEGRRERWCTSRPRSALVTISSKMAEGIVGAHQDHPVRWSPSRPKGPKRALVHVQTTLCVGHHLVQESRKLSAIMQNCVHTCIRLRHAAHRATCRWF